MTIAGKDLVRLGWKPGPLFPKTIELATQVLNAGADRDQLLLLLGRLASAPLDFIEDPTWGELARSLDAEMSHFQPTLSPEAVPFHVWGRDQVEATALGQLTTACRLPVSVAGAQMADGHPGYGLPIGGVLATRDVVIPYGVGVDIACRMKLSIVDEQASRLNGWRDMLRKALVDETAFGIGAEFKTPRSHDVMDDPLWNEVPKKIALLKNKAQRQLGSSGSGNHFVEWGELILERDDLGLLAGCYLALLSHSGSRGFGAQIAATYTQIAMELTPLPQEAKRLAWLELKSSAGQEYWNAMTLAGKYAAANHDLIHQHVLKAAGLKPAVQIENHHNFAWIEKYNGEDVVVHRKGATPAGVGVLGIIPGSMGDPGYVVRGLGNAASLHSASHGAGRVMSRTQAKRTITASAMRKYLKHNQVELISGGVDESPHVYKRIDDVMAAQSDLVEVVAQFRPRMVLMADDGESED